MKKLLILLAFAFLFLSLTSASSFDERKKYLLDYYSKARPNDQYWGDNDIKTAMGFVLARLETKKDVKYALNMQTMYMTWWQIILAAAGIIGAVLACVWCYRKAPLIEKGLN